MVYDGLDRSALDPIGFESQHAQHARQGSGANGHAQLVAQGDKGVLEAVVADAGFPLAVLHAVGDNGIDGRVEPAEEELGQGGAGVEGGGRFHRVEEVQGQHGRAGSGGEQGGGAALIAQPAEHEGEGGRAQDGGGHQHHGVGGEQGLAALHILEVVQQIGAAPVVGHAKEELPGQGDEIGLVPHDGL